MRRLFLGLAIFGFAASAPVWALAGDKEVAQQVAGNLRSSGQMKGYHIGVKVTGGVATLGGTVSDQQQMDRAISLAEHTPGVVQVVNGLSVASVSEGSLPSRSGEMQASQTQGLESPMSVQKADYYAQQTAARAPAAMPSVQASPVRAPQPAIAGVAPEQLPPNMNYYNQMPNGGMMMTGPGTQPIPAYMPGAGGAIAPVHYDHPNMPNYAWPGYAAYPNYAAVTYPRQYSPTAWPYIGPFYPYPQVPLGWRKVSLEWEDGWWFLDFCDHHGPNCHHCGSCCK